MKENLNDCLCGVTFRQLRAFSAVLEDGSISAAAERLHVTPPAISLQLRQLEEQVGIPLLHRRQPKGYRPTDAGQELLGTARPIEQALSEGAAALDSLRDGDAGRIVLGVISTAKYFAPRAVAAFKHHHPRIEIWPRVRFAVRREDKRLLPAAARLWRFLVEEGRHHLPHLTGSA